MKTNVDNPTSARDSEITTQADVTASRAINGTVYHNLHSKPMFVSISLDLPLNASVKFKCDQNATPLLIVNSLSNLNISDITMCAMFIVLPTFYYKVDTVGGGPSLSYWIEYV